MPNQALGGWDGNNDALKPAEIEIPTVTYNTFVVADGGSNYYRFSGITADDGISDNAQTLTLTEGTIYLFSQQNASNAGHPLRFSTTSNGTHNSGTEYTTGVTTFGTLGKPVHTQGFKWQLMRQRCTTTAASTLGWEVKRIHLLRQQLLLLLEAKLSTDMKAHRRLSRCGLGLALLQ